MNPTYLVMGRAGGLKDPAEFTDYLQAMHFARGMEKAGIEQVHVYLQIYPEPAHE